MRKLMVLATVCLVMVGLIAIGIPTGVLAKDIKVGAVINLTGPASTWGQFHAKGQQDYFRYINEVKGGIAGNKIDLTVVDHAYKVPEALKYVKKFCTSDKMDMIATWDAGSGIMAKPIIQKYKVPNINYSTSGHSQTPGRLCLSALWQLCDGLLRSFGIHQVDSQGERSTQGGSFDLQQRLWKIDSRTQPAICLKKQH